MRPFFFWSKPQPNREQSPAARAGVHGFGRDAFFLNLEGALGTFPLHPLGQTLKSPEKLETLIHLAV